MQLISELPNIQPISEIIVRCLAEYRHQSGKTLRELSEEMDWDHADISRIESRRKPPSIPFVKQAFGYLITKTKKNIA